MRGVYRWIGTLTLVAVVSPVVSGGGKDDTDIVQKIQGTWKYLSHEANGKPTPANSWQN
jgi:hypothetical protein